jgi:uncharacterized protein (DUF433 family)
VLSASSYSTSFFSVKTVLSFVVTTITDKTVQEPGQVMSEIVKTADTLHGKPRVKGTRIPVRTLYGLYNDGIEPEEIASRYPSINTEDVKEAVRYKQKREDKDTGVTG